MHANTCFLRSCRRRGPRNERDDFRWWGPTSDDGEEGSQMMTWTYPGGVSGVRRFRLGWRSRGAAGRRPVSREAVRQLHVSERLHRTSETIARKQEATRQRKRDLMQARVSESERSTVVGSTIKKNEIGAVYTIHDSTPAVTNKRLYYPFRGQWSNH